MVGESLCIYSIQYTYGVWLLYSKSYFLLFIPYRKDCIIYLPTSLYLHIIMHARAGNSIYNTANILPYSKLSYNIVRHRQNRHKCIMYII